MTEGGYKINSRIYKAILGKERICVLWGGSASGKTTNVMIYMIAQLFGDKSQNWNGAIVRRYYPELKRGLWKDAKNYIDSMGLSKRVKYNESELTITRGKRCISFMNAANEERFKGLDFNLIFIDECNQLEEETFMEILNRSGRAKGSQTKIIVAFNPISAYHWVYQKLVVNPMENSKAYKFTYHDNAKNLSQTYIDMLESWKDSCPRRYEIYTLGNAGVFEGLIYSPENWDMPDKYPYFDKWDCFGLDIGFNHPTAIIACKKMEDGTFYLHECYYQTETTISDVINWLNKTEDLYHWKRDFIPIYCDSARPDGIEEIARNDYNALKADKSVDDGISFCQGLKLHLTPHSTNLRGELETYSWFKDKDGNWTDKPVKLFDDGVDAMRYGLFSHWSKKRGKKTEMPVITSKAYNDDDDEWDLIW